MAKYFFLFNKGILNVKQLSYKKAIKWRKIIKITT
jgi:hypothetical protein